MPLFLCPESFFWAEVNKKKKKRKCSTLSLSAASPVKDDHYRFRARFHFLHFFFFGQTSCSSQKASCSLYFTPPLVLIIKLMMCRDISVCRLKQGGIICFSTCFPFFSTFSHEQEGKKWIAQEPLTWLDYGAVYYWILWNGGKSKIKVSQSVSTNCNQFGMDLDDSTGRSTWKYFYYEIRRLFL